MLEQAVVLEEGACLLLSVALVAICSRLNYIKHSQSDDIKEFYKTDRSTK